MEINKKNFKHIDPVKSEEWLIEHGYIYNKIFGWERTEIIERFKLNPEMKGVPLVLKAKWAEKRVGKLSVFDEYGNKSQISGRGGWEKHPTEKEWYPSENWLAYLEFKNNRIKQSTAESLIPMPEMF